MSGNPTSIVILASALANQRGRIQTLSDLYETCVKNKKEIFKTDNENNSEIEGRGYNPESMSSNNFSLQFTIDMGIKLLKETSEHSIELLYLLGCLPGGLTLSQLSEMWPDPEEPIT